MNYWQNLPLPPPPPLAHPTRPLASSLDVSWRATGHFHSEDTEVIKSMIQLSVLIAAAAAFIIFPVHFSFSDLHTR